ncbi:TIGR03808 family TAT-translocated repetitive protein [Maritalea sp.]|uniref:TIGR03808 family TAT-translocated repetitive protein n=1 Tax=Maritalea sp. TaxID=2003361 RepID=UPI003EF28720
MFTRRKFFHFFGAASAATMVSNSNAFAQFGAIDASELGLVPNASGDQSTVLGDILARASQQGQTVFLPAGEYNVSDVQIPSNVGILGANGRTILRSVGEAPVLTSNSARDISVENIVFSGPGGTSTGESFGLLDFTNCSGLVVKNCRFENAAMHGINLYGSDGTIAGNEFGSMANAAIMSMDASELTITDNHVDGCGNNGILVWRSDKSHDGTIVTNNHIKNIDWRNGGNGQNGNGINVFRAADVIVSNNVISDCAFSAIRANGTTNCQIIGNNCRNLSEVAIFSEFDFAGSVVAQNIIDEAAQGISITNWNDGGHLAVCSGNIIRNIWKSSPTNPDTVPVGIGVEADVAVDGNVIENVPGAGIAAGWGPYMRNISITDNLIRDVDVGVYVSVADGVGAAQVKSNLINNARRGAIVGARWDDFVEMDLQKNAQKYPFLSVDNNQIG